MLLAVGAFIEDFTDDLHPLQAGFDSWDADPNTPQPDGLHILNDLPRPNDESSGPTTIGGRFALDVEPGAPSFNHVLNLTYGFSSDGTHQNASAEFTFPQPASSGGFASDEEVVSISFRFKGLGSVQITPPISGNSSYGLHFSSFDWQTVTVTKEQVFGSTQTSFKRMTGFVIRTENLTNVLSIDDIVFSINKIDFVETNPIIIENFSDDRVPDNYGFDSWDNDPGTAVPDSVQIVNDLPYPVGNGPTSTGGYYTLTDRDRLLPKHILGLIDTGTGQATVSFRLADVGTPGGPEPGTQILAASLAIWGLGKIEFIGESGASKVVQTELARDPLGLFYLPLQKQTILVTHNDLLDSGNRLGPIREVKLTAFALPRELNDYPAHLAVDDVTFLVTVNQLPLAQDDEALAAANESTLVNVIANDNDPDGAGLDIDSFTQPTNGSVQPFDGNPLYLVYQPRADFVGDDSFTYTVRDATGNTTSATVRLRVNHRPEGSPDDYVFEHGRVGPLTLPVLANDSDADQEPLTTAVANPPLYGDVMVNSDGSYTYRPTTPDQRLYNDSFTYTVTDGNFVSLPIAVTLHVNQNQPPTALGGIMTADHGAPTPLHGSFFWSDRDGDAATAVLTEAPAHGSVAFHVVAGNVDVEYVALTAGQRAIGSDRFSYCVFDGYGQSEPVTIELRVPNNPPVAIADHLLRFTDFINASNGDGFRGTIVLESTVAVPYDVPDPNSPLTPFHFGETTVFHGQTRPVPGLQDTGHPSVEDFDDDGDPLTYEVVQQPLHGILAEFHGDTGHFVYWAPNPLLFPQRDILTGTVLKDLTDADGDGDRTEDLPWIKYGYDWFVYEVSDGHSSSQAVVLIEFSATGGHVVGSQPTHQDGVHAVDEAYEVQAGHSITVPKTAGLLNNDNPSDYRPPNPSVPFNPAIGPYIVQGPSHGHFVDPAGNPTDLLGANGAFAYHADAEFVGLDSVFYQLRGDPQPGRPELPHPAYVSFVIRNAPPEPQPDHYWVASGDLLQIGSENGPLANDSDFNGQSLYIHSFGQPAHGHIERSSAEGWFKYRSDPGFHGIDSFQYQVSDGFNVAAETVTITVQDPAIEGDVATVEIAEGLQQVVLLSSPGTTLEHVSASATPPATPPVEGQFPLGFFSFEIHGLAPGGAATVRILLPDGAPVLNEYWKYGSNSVIPADHWYKFASNQSPGADLSNPHEIVLHFVDGARGDDDMAANGVIVDPGAPAFVNPVPHVESVRINDGAAQRSKVNSITVNFDQQVIVSPGAFELRRIGSRPSIGFNLVLSEVGSKTVARLTFPGRHVGGSSLADGKYKLVIHGSKVHSRSGRVLDGNGDGLEGGNRVDEFFRLFGDTDGDGDVDLLDKRVFEKAFGKRALQPGYLGYLDANANGRIFAEDLALFLLNYGRCARRR